MDKEEPSSTRYFKDSYKVDIFSESSHALAVKLIGKNKRILEIGTSTGPLTECLSYLDNTIIGIEIDPEAAEKAAEFCERMIIADVETMDFADFFGEGEFDCILMTDVLEHLKWPEKILRDIRRYLSKNGFLVVSIPNICHGDVILNMLKGDFEYRETGLLDLTHIRFFALKNIIELFSKENYTITDLQRVKIKIGKTELKIKEEIPLIFVALLNAVPESDTYQYVFKAEPVDNAKTPIISSSLNQVAVEAEIGLEIRIFHLKIENDALKLKISSVTDQLHAQKTEHQSLQKQFQRQSIELASMKESIGWFFLMKFHKGIESLFPKKTRMRYLYDHVLIGGRILVNEGFSAFRTSVAHFLFYNNPSYQYKLWIKNNEPTKKELKRLREAEQNFPYQPKISIVVPVWNVEKKWLYIAIKSVIKQIYTNWELCIVDGGSTKPYIKRILTKYATKDPRIKVKFLGENKGIAENSNEALSLATGEFVGLLDHDDELAPFALYEVVKLLNENQDLDFIYSDEDKIDQKNHRKGPFFKPDWSPDLFLSQNYLCHFSIIRKKILGLVGGFHTGYDGSQDYDLFLRVTESIDESKIAHIPKILYHWRIIEGSAAGNLVAKPYAIQSAKKALEDALARRDIKAQVFDGISPSSYRISYSIEDNPRISIIIPTKDNINLLRRCVQSILEKTAYPNYEVVIVDNQSIEVETFTYYNLLEADPRITILFYNEPFNFSSINNFAVDHVESPYILFLNNDTEVINREWLSAMLEHAQRDCVGAVGAKLYYPNNTIQHAGVIIGLGGVAGHSHKYFDKDHPGYFNRLRMIQNCSAVTGACLLMRKNVFHEIGGFNKDLAIAFNDVDLCLKIRQAGYLIVYSPYAQLYHHESLSRGYEDTREKQMRFTKEKMFMIENWGNLIHKGDPYYNPNLTLEREDFSIKKC